jgi:hypothetical protein
MQRVTRQGSQREEPSEGGLRTIGGGRGKKAKAAAKEPTADDPTETRHHFHRADVDVDTMAGQFRGLRNFTFPGPTG